LPSSSTPDILNVFNDDSELNFSLYSKHNLPLSSTPDILNISNDDNELNASSYSLNAIENWRGLGKESLLINSTNKSKIIRPTKYMKANTEIEKLLIKRCTRSYLNCVLKNGNDSSVIIDKKQRYLVNNTCTFDFVAVIISKAYLDNPKYKTFIEDNKHQFLNFCKTLAIYGPSK